MVPLIVPSKKESREHRGLFVEQQADTVLVTYRGVWEAYSLETGRLVECSDRGTLPPLIRRYVEGWVESARKVYAKKKAGAATPAE